MAEIIDHQANHIKHTLDLLDQTVKKFSGNLMTIPFDEQLNELKAQVDFLKANAPSWDEESKARAEQSIAGAEKYLTELDKRVEDRATLLKRDIKLAEINARNPFTEADRDEANAVIRGFEKQ